MMEMYWLTGSQKIRRDKYKKGVERLDGEKWSIKRRLRTCEQEEGMTPTKERGAKGAGGSSSHQAFNTVKGANPQDHLFPRSLTQTDSQKPNSTSEGKRPGKMYQKTKGRMAPKTKEPSKEERKRAKERMQATEKKPSYTKILCMRIPNGATKRPDICENQAFHIPPRHHATPIRVPSLSPHNSKRHAHIHSPASAHSSCKRATWYTLFGR